MTFQNLHDKLLKRWWLIILITIGFSIIFYPWSNKQEYLASISLELNLNQNYQPNQTGDSDTAYLDSLKDFSNHLSLRLNSIFIRNYFLEEMGFSTQTVNNSSVYEVQPQVMGYAELTYLAQTEKEAEKFLEVSKQAYNLIVEDWNQARPSRFQLQARDQFQESINQTKKPIQFKILPSIAGLTLGLALAVIIPTKTKD